jgi:hypothetical protein
MFAKTGPLRIVKSPLEAYGGTFGVRRAQIQAGAGKQRGDPVRAADAIIKVAESLDPPLHLLLGANGLARVREELDDLRRSIDDWEEVTLSADFPVP